MEGKGEEWPNRECKYFRSCFCEGEQSPRKMAFSLLLYKNENSGVVWGMGVELAFSFSLKTFSWQR